MFFFMLILIGLDSQFTMTEVVITAILDEWPTLRRKRSMVVIATCTAMFFLGLSMCANGGVYMFQLMDWFSASWWVYTGETLLFLIEFYNVALLLGPF